MIDIKEEAFDFSIALQLLKKGHKLSREAWGSRNIFIYLVRPQNEDYYKDKRDVAPVLINSHIYMKTGDGSIIVGWIITTNDAMSEDWIFVR